MNTEKDMQSQLKHHSEDGKIKQIEDDFKVKMMEIVDKFKRELIQMVWTLTSRGLNLMVEKLRPPY